MHAKIVAWGILLLGVAAGFSIGYARMAGRADEATPEIAAPPHTAQIVAATSSPSSSIASTTESRASPPAATSTILLPIIVYHVVRPSYPTDSEAIKEEAVTPKIFDEEMNWLKTAGYTVVGFSDLENYFANSTPLPPHPIILSFDDGWSDQYEYAFPILQKYGYRAEFFVFTNGINTKSFLTWDELKKMQAAGMTIGSHSESHPYLTRISDPKKLWAEIYGSKEILEAHLDVPVREFAYPFGLYNASTTADIEKAGYAVARSDSYGLMQSPDKHYWLPVVNAPITLLSFEAHFPDTH
ncbi:MAG: polysaccharide deacetylase family protein [Minisyncoccia bacterium]